MKLYYFDIPGRGEAIRLLLRHARVPFEDVRIKFADWPKMKPTFDLQQLPVLECGGERLCQSYAILLSLGRKYGYMSTCPKEAGDAVCDMNTFEDLFNKYMAAFFPMSPYEGAQKTALQEAFVKTDFPFFMGYFEEKLKKNKSKEFMCGTNYTVADFYILGFYKQMKTVESFAKLADSMGTQFPLLKAYFEKRLDDLETSSAPKTVPPRPKLYYFDMEGRASMVRLLLRHAKVDFEDCRVSMADWPAMKDKFALKQMPVLEIDGKQLVQADAIMQFLCLRYGYLNMIKHERYYSTIWFANTAKDLCEGFVRFFFAPNLPEAVKKTMEEEYFQKSAPVILDAIEKRLKENSKSKEFLVGRKYSMADFYVLGAAQWVILNPASGGKFIPLMAKAPLLKAYIEKRLKDFA